MKRLAFCILGALLLGGCGHKLGYRHFAGPILPLADTEAAFGDSTYGDQFSIGDDHTITFSKNRLEISLQPITVDILNRQMASNSKAPEGFHQPNPYVAPNNPYTYGDWKPRGEDKLPERFTVFLLKVKNYAYPKVWLDPYQIEIVAPNGRSYKAFSKLAMDEYFSPYAIGYAGNTYRPFRERRDLLQRTLYPENEMIFSGQEREGFVVFYPLDFDVEDFEVRIKELVIRFDYRERPLETIDIDYQFTREVYLARQRKEQ